MHDGAKFIALGGSAGSPTSSTPLALRTSADGVTWGSLANLPFEIDRYGMAVSVGSGSPPPAGGDTILPHPFILNSLGRGGAGPLGFWTALQRSHELP